jgi:hypothetical protein
MRKDIALEVLASDETAPLGSRAIGSLTMNRGILKVCVVALFLIGAGSTGAQASVLGTLLPGGENVLSDESREMYVDVNGNNTIDAGDVIYGLLKISSVSSNNIDNTLYLAMSMEVSSVTAIIPGLYSYTMAPTTTSAYTLSTLTGSTVDAGAMLAIYDTLSGFSLDVTSMTTNMLSAIQTIASEGAFEASYGIGTANDYFQGLLTISGLTPSSIIGTLPTTATLGYYTAGLSLLDNNAPGTLDPNTYVYDFTTGNWYHAILSNGAFSGAQNVNGGVYDIKDKTDITLKAIPEPASLAVWSLVAGMVGLVVRRRRRS